MKTTRSDIKSERNMASYFCNWAFIVSSQYLVLVKAYLNITIEIMIWSANCYLVPVSYTHLDVYKRQITLLSNLINVINNYIVIIIILINVPHTCIFETIRVST